MKYVNKDTSYSHQLHNFKYDSLIKALLCRKAMHTVLCSTFDVPCSTLFTTQHTIYYVKPKMEM